MVIRFKPLAADDVEVRVQQANEKGARLLIYKDARVDMRMLDEVVGPENWQCSFYERKGTLFCSIGILVERGGVDGWVWKDNAGAPSNMEAEKGEASDAFKRAGFAWGIGRELYTAPSIFIPASKLAKLKRDEKSGKWVCRDRFTVKRFEVEDGRITALSIMNDNGVYVYQMASEGRVAQDAVNGGGNHQTAPQNADKGRYDTIRRLKAEASELGVSEESIDEWVAATFGGKDKRALTDAELRLIEKYLRGLIADEKSLYRTEMECCDPNA